MIPTLVEGGKHHETKIYKINILDEVSIFLIKFVPNLRDLNNTSFSWLLPARCNEQVWVRQQNKQRCNCQKNREIAKRHRLKGKIAGNFTNDKSSKLLIKLIQKCWINLNSIDCLVLNSIRCTMVTLNTFDCCIRNFFY